MMGKKIKFTSAFVPTKFGKGKFVKVQDYITIDGKKFKFDPPMFR